MWKSSGGHFVLHVLPVSSTEKGALLYLAFASALTLLLCSFAPVCTFLPGVRGAACSLGSAVMQHGSNKTQALVRLQYEQNLGQTWAGLGLPTVT